MWSRAAKLAQEYSALLKVGVTGCTVAFGAYKLREKRKAALQGLLTSAAVKTGLDLMDFEMYYGKLHGTKEYRLPERFWGCGDPSLDNRRVWEVYSGLSAVAFGHDDMHGMSKDQAKECLKRGDVFNKKCLPAANPQVGEVLSKWLEESTPLPTDPPTSQRVQTVLVNSLKLFAALHPKGMFLYEGVDARIYQEVFRAMVKDLVSFYDQANSWTSWLMRINVSQFEPLIEAQWEVLALPIRAAAPRLKKHKVAAEQVYMGFPQRAFFKEHGGEDVLGWIEAVLRKRGARIHLEPPDQATLRSWFATRIVHSNTTDNFPIYLIDRPREKAAITAAKAGDGTFYAWWMRSGQLRDKKEGRTRPAGRADG